MKHITIDYGIDLGTTNSAICRMEEGVPTIIRTDEGSETMPSCISFKKGGAMRIGQAAYHDLGNDKLRALKKNSASASNSLIEFKRFMGSDRLFSNMNTEHGWSPEALSAEVVRTLCSFVTDDEVKAAVITVPAKFTVNQKDATLTAARMAGIEQVELLQEPIAASMAYGLKAEEKNGIWMVFDFGGGTLDVALVNVRDGIMQIFDTEGDNYLGGKNLDEAIVSKLLIREIASRFTLDFTNKEKMTLLQEALKVEAEKMKNRLSFCETDILYLEAGDWGEDEDGEEIELEITVSRQELEDAIRPILQKTVDICKIIMERNNISFGQLTHLIPIGGPTMIPLLRQMLKEEVTENLETGINPMTTVATGAAIYASTIPVKTVENEENILQLLLDFDTTTLDNDVFIPIRTQEPVEGLRVMLIRRSDGWESEEAPIGDSGGIINAELLAKQPNIFRLEARINGELTKCFPAEITIVQGTRVVSAILPYHIGIEVYNPKKKNCVFASLTGLEKNRPLPATGNVYGLKTLSNLHPGKAEDIVCIAIYQGDEDAEGKTAVLFEYVSDVKITGEDIVSFIPVQSIINISINVDRSEMMTVTAEFPGTGQRVEKKLDTSQRKSDQTREYLNNMISQTAASIRSLEDQLNYSEELFKLHAKLQQVKEAFESGAQPKQVEQHVKEILRLLEEYEDSTEWERQMEKLKKALSNLESEIYLSGNDSKSNTFEVFKVKVERAEELKDFVYAKNLQIQIEDTISEMGMPRVYRDFLRWTDDEFCFIKWTNTGKARSLVTEAVDILREDPKAPLSKTKDIAEEINGMIIRSTPTGDNSPAYHHRIDLPSM